MNVVVAGGTGFIGASLIPLLIREGHRVVVLTRDNLREPPHPDALPVLWDGETQGEWAAHVREAEAIVNLTGASIGAGRWTPLRKRRILSSRLNSTRALLVAVRTGGSKPRVYVSSSAVGYYGDVASGEVTEDRPPGSGFLADVCLRWEQEALAFGELGIRVVLLRTAVVLGESGGALQKMILPFRFFAGGPVGSGRQWFPWVHRDDVAGIVLFSLANASLRGPVNVVAPESVTMKSFSSALGRALSRPSWLPVPATVLRFALGEMADMLLTGQRAVPAKLLALGYGFRHPSLDEALASVV